MSIKLKERRFIMKINDTFAVFSHLCIIAGALPRLLCILCTSFYSLNAQSVQTLKMFSALSSTATIFSQNEKNFFHQIYRKKRVEFLKCCTFFNLNVEHSFLGHEQLSSFNVTSNVQRHIKFSVFFRKFLIKTFLLPFDVKYAIEFGCSL
jgi:hypothetical protein